MSPAIRSAIYNRGQVPPTPPELPAWLVSELGNIERAIAPNVCRTVTANTTQQPSDRYILVDATAGPISVTLIKPTLWPPFALTVMGVSARTTSVTLIGTVNGMVNPTLRGQISVTIISDGVALWYEVEAPEFISLADFGAVGDGVTDDLAAVDAAFSISGRMVFVPAGTYRVSANPAMPACSAILGEGADISVIQCAPGVTKGLSIGAATKWMSHLGVTGNGTTNAIGIIFGDIAAGGAAACTMVAEDIRVSGFTGTGAYGVKYKSVLKSRFIRMYYDGNTSNDIVDGTGGISGDPTTLTFDSMINVNSTVGSGTTIINADGVIYNQCAWDSNAGRGFYVVPVINGTVDGVVLHDPRFEDNGITSGAADYQVFVDGSAGGTTTSRVDIHRPAFYNSVSLAKSLRMKGAGCAPFLLTAPQVPNQANTILIDTAAYGNIANWPNNLPYGTCVSDTSKAANPTLGAQSISANAVAWVPTLISDIGNQAATFAVGPTISIAAINPTGKYAFLRLRWSGTLQAVTPAYIEVSLPAGFTVVDAVTRTIAYITNAGVSEAGEVRYNASAALRFYRNSAALYGNGAVIAGEFVGYIELV